jgi:glycosyltransferase involved in cell wall biosynthesis
MKILHICNTAGVGSIIAKYMDRLFGTESLVVNRHVLDPYGFTTYGEIWSCSSKIFTLKCLLIAKRFDIIHIHYFDKIIPLLKLLYPKKLVVMHYHGDDIRGKWGLKRKYWSKADVVIYSTLDLLDKETPRTAIYMPNPVDTEIFYPRKIKQQPKTAFHLSYNADNLAKEYAGEHNLKLTIFDLKKRGCIRI